ncbi:MAG: GxxExxY protein, partial [Nitrospinae bacterium]|nr:GxxExxY protein [Nitrospinota bacterium]
MEIEYEKDKLTELIIQSIIRVHQILGPGFLESIYRKALMIELRKQGLNVETEKEAVVYYEAEEVGRHRLDIVVGDRVIIELKTVEELSKAHYAQVRS